MANHRAERALKRCIGQRQNALFDKSEPSASIARGRTRLMATGIDAGVHAVEDLVALPEHRREVFSDPAAGRPWAEAASRASPEATRRPSWAIWARSGGPFQIQIMSSRADRGPWASALGGPPEKRPVDHRFIMSPSP
jgi:hypothetical protein